MLCALCQDAPLTIAALIGCAVTTGVGAVTRRARVQPGSSVAVFGCGGIGINVVQAAALSGVARIITVDLADNKLEMAESFGATHSVNAREGDPMEVIRDLTDSRGEDFTFEAIGIPVVMQQSIDAARRDDRARGSRPARRNEPVGRGKLHAFG